MSDYRRHYVPGGTYFFTVVSHERRAILTSDLGRSCLRRAIADVRRRYPFEIAAIVLLPEHLHTIWSLPAGDGRFSERWKRIKEEFTTSYLAGGGDEGARSESRLRQGERGVWQRRFWEHVIRDEVDFERCLDYIHWNPVKHGLVGEVRDYPWSSFARFVKAGVYPNDWGAGERPPDLPGAEWD